MRLNDEQVLKHLHENGFLLLNEDPDYPSICSIGGNWQDLMQLVKSSDAFLTKWVKNKRTVVSRRVYEAFQCLEPISTVENPCELAILNFLRINGRSDIMQLHTCLPFSKKELVKAMTSLQNRLLIVVIGEAKSLTEQWGVYAIEIVERLNLEKTSNFTKLEAQLVISKTFKGVLTERQLTNLSGRHIEFPKYYHAYDARYKRVHDEKLLWFLDKPTPEVLEWLKELSVALTESICEVGCGEGRDALHLAGLGYSVLGLDVSEEAIRLCEQRSMSSDLNVTWRVADLAVPNFKPNETFKGLYSIATLHMLTEVSDRKTFLKNLYAMLEPGGSLLLVNKGDGVGEKQNKEVDAFQLVERTHMHTGKSLMLPATSFYQTTWDKMHIEVTQAGYTILKQFVSENENYGQCMTMYLTR